MGKKVSAFVIFVNEKRDLNPEWKNKSASEWEQLCQPMWQRLSPEERKIYKPKTIGQQSKKGEVRDGGSPFGRGGLSSRAGYGAGYGGPFGRGGYGGPLGGGYGGVGSYGGPFGGSYGGGGGYGGPIGCGYGVGGVEYGGGGSYGGGGGGGPALTNFMEKIGQRKSKAKNDAQSNEVKSRAVVHISETQAAQLKETLGQIDNIKDYEDRSSSGNSFLTTLQQNHEANAERTKGEIPQLKAREEHNPVKDYVSQEHSKGLPDVDLKLKQKNREKMTNPRYTKMLEFRRKLPAYSMRKELMDLISKNQVVLVSGETGCGKSTQVPQFILDQCIAEGQGAACRVVCTQPRRIAATSVAERVANERGEALGDSVGFQIRLESRLPRKTGSILFCTTGVVLQWLRSVPLIDNVSHIVLDEIHERDILSDLLLAILKDLLPRRPDLKLILMSATLNAEKFSLYYGNCPVITIPGFTYPVEEFYLEDVVKMTGFKFNPSEKKFKKEKDKKFTKMIEPFLRDIEASGSYSKQTIDFLRSKESENLNMEIVAILVKYIHEREKDGAILVFVPGWSEISKLNKMLEKDPKFRLQGDLVIYTLHSMMTTGYQREIFERPNEGTRKIIIATNIAETSITVDDVVYVVNCGGIKVTNFDESTNLNSLDTQWVSLANARQRRGRAGRVQEGKCYHLYTRAREKLLDSYLLPEMRRSRLEEVILQIKILELGDAKKFLKKVLDPPSDKTIALSMELLLTINAVITNDDALEELTPLGYHLAKLPVDPLIGKMILLSAIFSCLDPVLSIAASLSFKDPFVLPLGKEKSVDEKRRELASNTMSDHLTIANALAGWETSSNREEFCFEYFLSESVMNMLLKLKQQFAQHLHNHQFLNSPSIWSMDANKNSHNEALVRAVVCAGLYPNVAKLKRYLNPKGNSRSAKTKLMSKTDPVIMFHMKSANGDVESFPYPWVVYHQKLKSTSVNLHDSSVVSPLSLLLFGRYVRVGQETMGDTGQRVDCVAADDYAKFNCEAAIGGLVHKLRGHLDQLLVHKLKYPAPTDWSNSQREGLLLESIVEILTSELSPEIEGRICASNSITTFFRLVSKTWEDELILINSMLPTRLLLSDGCDTTEVLMKDENSNAISSKTVIPARRSFDSFSSHATFLVLRSSSTTVELAQTELLQSRPLRNRVADLKKEQEAGIISLQLKESSVVLYCFPPSEFSTGLLKRAAGKFSDEMKKDDYLVAVVVRESHNYDQAILDSIEEVLTTELKSYASKKIGAKEFSFDSEKKGKNYDQYGVDVSKGVNC